MGNKGDFRFSSLDPARTFLNGKNFKNRSCILLRLILRKSFFSRSNAGFSVHQSGGVRENL